MSQASKQQTATAATAKRDTNSTRENDTQYCPWRQEEEEKFTRVILVQN
jgi:hypothetical protein